MSTTKTIIIAKDFSEEPIGRYPEDSPDCGQNFRENLLAPSLRANDVVIVNLDGTEGYGSSFLEEAFGGLVRKCGFSKSELTRKLQLISEEDTSLITEIQEYIDTASSK